MRISLLHLLILCPTVAVVCADETNIIYKSVFMNGTTVEIKETRRKESRQPSVTELAQMEQSRKNIIKQEMNPEGFYVIWDADLVLHRYKMRISREAKPPSVVWEKEVSGPGELSEQRLSIFDVAEQGDRYAILFANNLGVFIDVVNSEKKGNRSSRQVYDKKPLETINRGRIVWMDDLYVVIEVISNDAKDVELWKIGEDKVTRVSG